MPGSPPSTGVSFSGAPGLLLVIRITCCASLLADSGWTWCDDPASAQTMMPSVHPGGRLDTLGAGSTVPPVGIPLGSTDLATPGLSPAPPPTGVGSAGGNSDCSGSSNSAAIFGSAFDGGGFSTTPVVYLYLDALGAWPARTQQRPTQEALAPAAE